MMAGVPRRPVRRSSRTPPRPLHGSLTGDRVETRGAVGWNVRTLAGSIKEYRCPGCHQLVQPGTGHLLVWPVQKGLLSAEAIDERRHWHSHCWQRGF